VGGGLDHCWTSLRLPGLRMIILPGYHL
jgi:hypothetical protein